jgi:hypothetical protein
MPAAIDLVIKKQVIVQYLQVLAETNLQRFIIITCMGMVF